MTVRKRKVFKDISTISIGEQFVLDPTTDKSDWQFTTSNRMNDIYEVSMINTEGDEIGLKTIFPEGREYLVWHMEPDFLNEHFLLREENISLKEMLGE